MHNATYLLMKYVASFLDQCKTFNERSKQSTEQQDISLYLVRSRKTKARPHELKSLANT